MIDKSPIDLLKQELDSSEDFLTIQTSGNPSLGLLFDNSVEYLNGNFTGYPVKEEIVKIVLSTVPNSKVVWSTQKEMYIGFVIDNSLSTLSYVVSNFCECCSEVYSLDKTDIIVDKSPLYIPSMRPRLREYYDTKYSLVNMEGNTLHVVTIRDLAHNITSCMFDTVYLASMVPFDTSNMDLETLKVESINSVLTLSNYGVTYGFFVHQDAITKFTEVLVKIGSNLDNYSDDTTTLKLLRLKNSEYFVYLNISNYELTEHLKFKSYEDIISIKQRLICPGDDEKYVNIVL